MGKTLREVKKDTPASQLFKWSAWLEMQAEQPQRMDWLFASVVQAVRQVLAERPQDITMDDCRVPFNAMHSEPVLEVYDPERDEYVVEAEASLPEDWWLETDDDNEGVDHDHIKALLLAQAGVVQPE